MYKVFKFGGASVKDAEAVRQVAHILEHYKAEKIVVVVSAMGKTTNALEAVVKAHAAQDGTAQALLQGIKEQHFSIMKELFDASDEAVFSSVNDTFVEAEWTLEDAPEDNFDFMYDQIVSVGELVSTLIVEAFLRKKGVASQWLDVRSVLFTDDTWREGQINWEKTKDCVRKTLPNLFEKHDLVVTQGFIGSTDENYSITLGREGSDYSAAIFAHCLDAESMTIWKDVPGVMTGDPRLFENLTLLPQLSYKEAIEMTYYGATVIHPKTIKPIQNKGILLHVRSFLNLNESGTTIGGEVEDNYPPIVVVKKEQTLLQISTRDFSFVAEHHLAMLFEKLAVHRIFVNSMQNSAISFTICVGSPSERIEQFKKAISDSFSVNEQSSLELITVRHYNEAILENLKAGKVVLFEERIRNTVQMVVRDVPVMVRIQ